MHLDDTKQAEIINFSPEFLNQLVSEGEQSPRRRQHWNIHQDTNEKCQRLFNAICVDSYIRPHRHSLDPKSECLIAVRGLLTLVIFDSVGSIAEVIPFGIRSGISAGIELPSGVWHTVVASEPRSIVFEVKSGPFDETVAKEFAPWAPAESSPDALKYLHDIHRKVAMIVNERRDPHD